MFNVAKIKRQDKDYDFCAKNLIKFNKNYFVIKPLNVVVWV